MTEQDPSPSCKTSDPQSLAHGEGNAVPPIRRAGSLRAISVGLTGVALIASFTYWNDWVVRSNWLTSTFLPIGTLLVVSIITLLVNVPLRRWAPRQVFSSGELSVILAMLLVGSAIPNVGLMRYLPGHLAGFYYLSASDPAKAQIMADAAPPAWLFPTVEGATAADKGNAPEIRDYIGRVSLDDRTFGAMLRAVPWHAWVRPMLAWGIMLGMIYGALICLGIIFRAQWAENERLPFPIASIYGSLIEPPAQGHILNSMLRNRGMWIVAAVVFAICLINGLNAYAPRVCPKIPLGYDLTSLFSADPWRSMDGFAKRNGISFVPVALAFFLQTKVSFSLWFCFLAMQLVRMQLGMYGQEMTWGMIQDQTAGALLPYGIAMLWVARQHLGAVFGQMVRSPRPGEPMARYLSYRITTWGLLACIVGMHVWLVLAGMTLAGAFVLVTVILFSLLILARIVAETGLLYVVFDLPPNRLWVYAAQDLPTSMQFKTSAGSFFHSCFFNSILLQDKSQAVSPHLFHSLWVSDQAALYEQRRPERWRLVFALGLALAVSYGCSFAGTLFSEYNYDAPLVSGPPGSDSTSKVNEWGMLIMPRWLTLEATTEYMSQRGGPADAHNRMAWLASGVGLSAAFSWLRLRFTGWPLHPVGLIMANTYSGGALWFSIFAGWLLKVIILKLGGSRLLKDCRYPVLGLVVGAAAAAVLWTIITWIRISMGLDYRAIKVF